MDPSAAQIILTTDTYSSWRQYPVPRASSWQSAAQELIAGNHYYMKIYHSESSYSDHMTVGLVAEFNDGEPTYKNAETGWTSLIVRPDHQFERYEINLVNPVYDPNAVIEPPTPGGRNLDVVFTNYRIQFHHSTCSSFLPGHIDLFCALVECP
jgi:hypothetical protein